VKNKKIGEQAEKIRVVTYKSEISDVVQEIDENGDTIYLTTIKLFIPIKTNGTGNKPKLKDMNTAEFQRLVLEFITEQRKTNENQAKFNEEIRTEIKKFNEEIRTELRTEIKRIDDKLNIVIRANNLKVEE
jgi:hypothetical protein